MPWLVACTRRIEGRSTHAAMTALARKTRQQNLDIDYATGYCILNFTLLHRLFLGYRSDYLLAIPSLAQNDSDSSTDSNTFLQNR